MKSKQINGTAVYVHGQEDYIVKMSVLPNYIDRFEDLKESQLKSQKVILWTRETDSKMYLKKIQSIQHCIKKEKQRIEPPNNFTVLSSSLA